MKANQVLAVKRCFKTAHPLHILGDLFHANDTSTMHIPKVLVERNLLSAKEAVDKSSIYIKGSHRVARWYISETKITIWVYFGGPGSGECVIFCVHLNIF
jgi:hypothetical protein